MNEVNQHNIDCLIDCYTNLIELINKFPNLQFGGDSYRYEDLVKRLCSIRQLIIDKDLANINVIYKPMLTLFNHKEHFTTLEEAIQFYRQNPSIDYPMPTASDDTINTNNENNQYSNEQVISSINQSFSILTNEIKLQLSEIKELTGNKFANDDINRFSNDILATLTTSRELMKSDIAKYDELLTNHINKSSIYIVEAIEKEHTRFVQRMSSDVNAIIAGISSAASNEFSTQTDLIKDSMKALDDKSFKRSCVVFVGVVSAVFACSFLSAAWTMNKVVGSTKLFRIEVTHKPTTPVNSRKTGTH